MTKIDKALVLRRFSTAAEHYDKAALPQSHFAKELLAFMQQEEFGYPAPGNVLEVGCGTGLFSEQLIRWLGEERYTFYLNDLSPAVERRLREKVGIRHHFIVGDAEELPWQEEHYTLIASASTIQWWHQPLSFIAKSAKALTAGGHLAYATYLPTNLYQLQQVTKNGLHYPTREEHKAELRASGFEKTQLHEHRYTLHFSGIVELLQHLKQTGTNALARSEEGAWTRTRLTELERAYRAAAQLSPTERLPLTYVALLVTARK